MSILSCSAILGFNIDGFSLSFPVILVDNPSIISAYLMMSFMLELAKKINFITLL